MIVSTMTPEEMLVDARKDMGAILNRCKEPTRKLRKAHLRNRKNDIEHMISWNSPRGNKWLITICYNKRKPLIYTLVWYYDKKGRVSAMICSTTGSALTICPHVIERYGDRYDPVVDPVQRLKVFFADNPSFSFDTKEEIGEDEWEMLVGMNSGLGLGVWKEDSQIIEVRTFVNREMLFSEQKEYMKELDAMRLLQSLTPGQVTEFGKHVNEVIAKHEANNRAA